MKDFRKLTTLLLIALTTSLASCKKDRPEEVITDPLFIPDLVKTVKWANTGKESYSYHADSTLKQTVAGSAGTMTVVRDFQYANKRLTRIVKADMMEEIYDYHSNGLVRSITEKMVNQSYPGTRLEFEYYTNGTLKQMKYYEFDDLGSDLKSTTTYEHDQQRPKKITTVSGANPASKVIFDIEGYSEEVFLNPWTFIEPWHLVTENFQIYNYPLLRSLRTLPLKVTRKFELNGVAQSTKTENFSYDIKNGRLESILFKSNNFKVTYEY